MPHLRKKTTHKPSRKSSSRPLSPRFSQLNGLVFNQPQLLTNALTHRSALNEKKGKQSYERLEFLGDAVLELVVSDYLYHHFPHQAEGKLTHLRAKMVQTKTLAAAATRLQLGQKLVMSRGEKQAGGQKNVSLLADCFEAVVGAIYLDQGLTVATDFIHRHLLKQIKTILKDVKITDYKSQLQEKWQKKFKLAPIYRVVKTSGPDHHKTFIVNVCLKQKVIGQGRGKSKQDAEQQAAQAALEKPASI